MLNVTVNLETGLAKLSQTTAIKAGRGGPMTSTFPVNPGTSPVIKLALSALPELF